ncbi:MAG: STAS/SEC14 domain-containing protein [Gammaproteobacteria bacterium]|nr:STAS/SEC14 domain-containing protein [Gammaproteobacteria bacterium]
MTYEVCLPAEQFGCLRVTHSGAVTKREMLLCWQEVASALATAKASKMLVDFADTSELPNRDYFIMFFAMHADRLSQLAEIAVVNRHADESDTPVLGDVAHQYHINCRTFREADAAVAWISRSDGQEQ